MEGAPAGRRTAAPALNSAAAHGQETTMSLSRRELLRYGAVATAAATALPLAGTATASAATAPAGSPSVISNAATDDATKIIAAYRELQIGTGAHSPRRDAALAALDVVAVQYNSSMNVAADQLWPDLPTG